MPEGPECLLVADAINQHCEELFESAEIIENIPGKLHRYSRKPPKNFDVIQNCQWILKKAEAKGKLIYLDIEIYKTGDRWVGLSTLGMSGDWRWDAAGHKHTRLAFIKHRGDLSFVDARCFGTFRITTLKDAEKAKEKIGWDLLKAPMPTEQWKQLQRHPKVKKQIIGSALLTQNIWSGLGNIYKAETLYEVGIDPRLPIEAISQSKWIKINTTAHQILQRAYALNGSSIADFTANGVEGQAQTVLKIYGKKVCPLGHQVESIKQGKGANERTTWFCQKCLDFKYA